MFVRARVNIGPKVQHTHSQHKLVLDHHLTQLSHASRRVYAFIECDLLLGCRELVDEAVLNRMGCKP